MTHRSDRVIVVAQDTGAYLRAGVVPEQRCHPPALLHVKPAGDTGRQYIKPYVHRDGNV